MLPSPPTALVPGMQRVPLPGFRLHGIECAWKPAIAHWYSRLPGGGPAGSGAVLGAARRIDGGRQGEDDNGGITVIGGGGYVGLSYAAAFAELGHDVVGLDVDEAKVGMLAAGRSPIFEPGLEDSCAGARRAAACASRPTTPTPCRSRVRLHLRRHAAVPAGARRHAVRRSRPLAVSRSADPGIPWSSTRAPCRSARSSW